MTDSYDTLKEYYLPEAFAKDGFIRQSGRPMEYSYEDYLREFINNSDWFMEKTKGEKFHKPKTESHGESDAITDNYEIDFKLILSKSTQYARNQTSEQIEVNDAKSQIWYMHSKCTGTFQSRSIQAQLKELETSDLRKISGEVKNKNTIGEKSDLHAFVGSIKKDKNVLMYYPALLEFRRDECYTILDACDVIFEGFRIAVEFRREEYPERENYLAFFFNHTFCILDCNKKDPVLVDRINPRLSTTFMDICKMHDTFLMYPMLGRLIGE